MSRPPAARGTNTRLADVLIGSHVHQDDPLAAAQADGADVVQFFLGNPQSWKKPKPRDDAETLKASSMPLYVHAPYLINVASANNRIRIPSRKILQDTCDAASEINATAVIVHGGHADDNDMEAGYERWVKALKYLETDVQVLLETPRAATTRWPATSTPSGGCGITSATAESASAWTPATHGRPGKS